MKKFLCVCTLLALLCFPSFGEEGISVDIDKLSESLGHLIAKNLTIPGFTCNYESLIKGIRDEIEGKASPLTEEEYEQAIYAIQEKAFVEIADKNLIEANAFLASNATALGIKKVEQNLQYRVIQEGTGDEVQADSIPLIQYKGTLLDGTEFASSTQPTSFSMAQAIPGFAKGMLGMKEGEKRILYIHPTLAYGTSGGLPPNSLLIFEVEVLKTQADQKND